MPVSLLRPGQRVGHYVLEERIGVGGMGEVWKGRHELLARQVAVKSIAPHLAADPQFANRFRLEAKAQAALVHPRIVSVTDFFFVPEGFFLVMPLIEGESLERRLERQHPLEVAEAFAIAVDILDALGYAHARGVIHRDVKPSNILVDTHGHGYLTDFGIALMVGQQRLTQTGASIGTPHYMSPEQILRPRQLDHRTDIYSFGCVLFEMLVGRPPFDATTEGVDPDFVVKEAHLRQPPPSPLALNPALPPPLEPIILRALAKKPEERFQTCADFALALASTTLDAMGTAATVALAVAREPLTPGPPSEAPPHPPLPVEPAPLPPTEAAPRPPTAAPTRRPATASALVLALLAAPLLLALALLASRARPSARLTVGPQGADERSIAAALARVRTGGTVAIQPGVYRESVRLEREVELVADGTGVEVIIEGTAAPAAVLAAPRTTLRGLTLRTAAVSGGAPSPVLLVQTGEVRIEDCTLAGGDEATARLGGTSRPTLRRSRFFSSGAGDAVVVEGRARATFEDCQLANGQNGVVVREQAEATLRGSRVLACQGAGVRILDQGLAILDGSRVESCGQAGVDASAGRLQMRLGVVHGGHGAGVVVRDGADALVEDTEVAENSGHGVEVAGAQATLVGCTIRGNGGRGIWARDGATVVTVRSSLVANLKGAQGADRTSTIRRQ